jgi:hypothetical protein
MARKQARKQRVTRTVDQPLPTADDLKLIAALPGGPAPKSLRALSSKFVDLLAMPAMQARLKDIAPQIASFKGCNVDAGLARVNETSQLIQVAARVQNAFVCVRQRIVENNRWLRTFQTNLAHAQATAAPNSPVALGLAQMVARRYNAMGVPTAAKTRAKQRRAKAKPPAVKP